MKRIIALLLAALVLCALAACGAGGSAEQPTVAATEAETDAPYIATPVDEPEWTLAEGELKLEDKDNIYAEGDDILYFAIVGTTEEDMELRFRLDDVTANMLTQQSPDNQYYITLNGEKIGNAELSDDCTVATIKGQHTYDEMTALATRIRGLAEE